MSESASAEPTWRPRERASGATKKEFCLTVMKELNLIRSLDMLLVFRIAKPETSRSGRIFPRFKNCCPVCFRRLLK